MLIGPGLLEGVGGGEGLIRIRCIGTPTYNGSTHEEGDPTPTNPLQYPAYAGSGYKTGDMLVTVMFLRGAGSWSGWTQTGDNITSYYYKIAESDGVFSPDDQLYLDGATSDGPQAIFYMQTIALYVHGGGTVEFLSTNANSEVSFDASSADMTVPTLGVGPNPKNTFVLGMWIDWYIDTRSDLDTWGTPNGFDVQAMADDPDGLTVISRNYGNPEVGANEHHPPFTYNVGRGTNDYHYLWCGWGYESQSTSAAMAGGDIQTDPGGPTQPFSANSTYSTRYIRFGIAS